MKKSLLIQILFPFLTFAQKPYTPDTSINGVSLMDWKSFERKFSGYKLPDYFEADHSPKLEFISFNKSQKLVVSHCYGSHKNSICTFRVEFRKKADSIPSFGVLVKEITYKTGRGIYLGMTIEEFKKKVETKKYESKSEKGKLKITIKLDDLKNNPFLQSYNMPVYLGKYYFKRGRLILFEFGFPNP